MLLQYLDVINFVLQNNIYKQPPTKVKYKVVVPNKCFTNVKTTQTKLQNKGPGIMFPIK